MIRWHRMLGDPSLWVPGRDHAGIAGQLVVERDLKAKGIDRHELGREKFLDQMWEWMETLRPARSGTQLRRLGASADWSREMFTMDAGPRARGAHGVRAALREGPDLSRPPHRQLVHGLPDGAVRPGGGVREVQGQLTYVRYPVDRCGKRRASGLPWPPPDPRPSWATWPSPSIPTTRATRDLIGKHVRIPHVNRIGEIVGDEAVDPEFGTGAVKVTPAHDPTDFEIAQRHDLPCHQRDEPRRHHERRSGRVRRADHPGGAQASGGRARTERPAGQTGAVHPLGRPLLSARDRARAVAAATSGI